MVFLCFTIVLDSLIMLFWLYTSSLDLNLKKRKELIREIIIFKKYIKNKKQVNCNFFLECKRKSKEKKAKRNKKKKR